MDTGRICQSPPITTRTGARKIGESRCGCGRPPLVSVVDCWPHLAVLEPGFTIVVGDLNLLKRERPVLKFQPARTQLFPQPRPPLLNLCALAPACIPTQNTLPPCLP